MRNIFRDGYVIVRDGHEITLTGEDISNISHAIDAAYGWNSVKYYLDTLTDTLYWTSDEEDRIRIQKKIDMAEEILEDEKACYEIWNDYDEDISYESGEQEWNAVDGYIINRL